MMLQAIVGILIVIGAGLPIKAQAVYSQSTAQSQARVDKITVSFDNTPLKEALWTIARRSGTQLFFDGNTLPDKKVTYNGNNVAPAIALRDVLAGTGLRVVKGEGDALQIVSGLGAKTARGQGVISGRIADAKTGKGLSGATVSVGSEARGVTSGEDGSYRMTGIGAGTQTISVRSVGYAKQTKTVNVGDGATVTADFKLEPSANVLDQVIVTGTVAQTELKAVPNAMTVITAKQIEERGITRIDQLFRGEIPGLFALEQGTNTAFDEVVMYSRGTTKISTDAASTTNPIKTYIDGIEMADPKYLSQIDPKSIERIEILSGPQASTIYGANAINGVMQIFTKRGTTVKPSLTLNLAEGFAQNNMSSHLAASHQYDGSVSGVEGRLSYNVGGGWDYAGSWSPGKLIQRTSLFGSGRYQTSLLSFDGSVRRGRTKNKISGDNQQVNTELAEIGVFDRTNGFSGLFIPTASTLYGRTLGATVGYTPFAWWSHQLTVGSDAADTETLRSGAAFSSPSDTAISGNTQSFSTRASQSYSSTLRIPILSAVQATITYGGDHWRTRSSTLTWNKNLDGTIVSPGVTRNAPSKNKGAFVQGQFGLWDALFLTYGVRADWNPNYGAKAKVRPGRYGVSYARDFGNVSAKLRGSYGRSIRPPVAGLIQGVEILPTNSTNIAYRTVYGIPLYQTLPSPELGPEFQQGGEGGLELYLGNRGSLVITRYNQTVDGLISTIPNVDSARALSAGNQTVGGVSICDAGNMAADGYCYFTQVQNLNVGSIRNQGWEFQGSVNVGPFTTRGTYSLVKSRVIGITERYRPLLTSILFLPGQTVNFIPEHTWAVNLSYANRGTSASLNVNGFPQVIRRIAGSDIIPVTTTSLRLRAYESYSYASLNAIRTAFPGYSTANLNASQRFSAKIDATLQVMNLTDHYHNDTDYRFPTMGRQTRIGLRWRP